MSIRSRLIVSVIGMALAFGAGWRVQGWRWDADLAQMERDWTQQIADAQALARSIEQARWAAREGVIDEAKKKAAAAAADADRVRADLDRVRGQLAKLQRDTRDTAATKRSEGVQGADPIGMLADMYERGQADTIERSRYADALQQAGLICERLYDSLLTE
ncbi:DUF2514 family protein [Alcaligenes nematophilus]|uniref:DUF2514 family protein n=1 Tax=Alcaligenes nematophilus TaxID=2994643 RepID=UPI0034E09BF5